MWDYNKERFGSSHRRWSLKKGVLKNFAKFMSFSIKLHVKACKFLRTPFLQNNSGRLLLKFAYLDYKRSCSRIFTTLSNIHEQLKKVVNSYRRLQYHLISWLDFDRLLKRMAETPREIFTKFPCFASRIFLSKEVKIK